MKSKMILILLFVLIGNAEGQWSTSNKTQDALFACPGFYSDIVTYLDGSSIIIGIGDNNEIWMQKFDPYGYKQWFPYVTVFPAMSNALRYFLPDDDGGIYAIIGTQTQRVDKNGNLRWGANGKKIIPSGSLTKAITDGQNGFIGIYNYFDSLQRIVVFRYDSSGTIMWQKQIDSNNTEGILSCDLIGRLKDKTLFYTSTFGYKFIDNFGDIHFIHHESLKTGNIVCALDTAAYNLIGVSSRTDSLGRQLTLRRVTKYNKNWDSLWSTTFEMHNLKGSYSGAVSPVFAPDGFDGIYFFGALFDTNNAAQTQIQRVNENGRIWGEEGIILNNKWGIYPFVSKGEIGFIFPLDGKAQKIDTTGKLIWNEYLTVITDIDNTFFNRVKSDNNGGGIMSFWTVTGGVKVQHTGRIGKVGVITKINSPNEANPYDFVLYQNYPNPFNSTTQINYYISNRNKTTLTIYDVLGKTVKTIVSEEQDRGLYSIKVDLDNRSSGIYFYRIESGGLSSSKKMIFMK